MNFTTKTWKLRFTIQPRKYQKKEIQIYKTNRTTLSPVSVAESPHVHHQKPAKLTEVALWNWNSLQPPVGRAASSSEKKQPLLRNRHRHTKSHSYSHTRSHPRSDCNSRAARFVHQTPLRLNHSPSLIPGTRSFCSTNLDRTFFSGDGQSTVIHQRSYEIFSWEQSTNPLSWLCKLLASPFHFVPFLQGVSFIFKFINKSNSLVLSNKNQRPMDFHVIFWSQFFFICCRQDISIQY